MGLFDQNHQTTLAVSTNNTFKGLILYTPPSTHVELNICSGVIIPIDGYLHDFRYLGVVVLDVVTGARVLD
jgi:hypothetical protein